MHIRHLNNETSVSIIEVPLYFLLLEIILVLKLIYLHTHRPTYFVIMLIHIK